MAIFKGSSEPGTIVVVRGQEGEETPKQGIIQLEGEGGDLTASEDIIIVSAQMQQQVAYKTGATIGGPEYMFVFGDRLSPVTVSVILFQDALCEPGDGGGSTSEGNGVVSILKFYNDNRITPSEALLLTMAYNGATIRGFLTGIRLESQTNRGRQVHSATLSMIGWIDSESLGSANTNASSGGGSPPANANSNQGGGGAGSFLGDLGRAGESPTSNRKLRFFPFIDESNFNALKFDVGNEIQGGASVVPV